MRHELKSIERDKDYIAQNQLNLRLVDHESPNMEIKIWQAGLPVISWIYLQKKNEKKINKYEMDESRNVVEMSAIRTK